MEHRVILKRKYIVFPELYISVILGKMFSLNIFPADIVLFNKMLKVDKQFIDWTILSTDFCLDVSGLPSSKNIIQNL